MTKVSLVAITAPTICEAKTPEELIAYVARVSNPSNQANTETAPKLLKYLIKNKHWSPFEMVSITMEINTPRDIARQILRHRSFSFQEFSQRYANPENLGYTLREARLQDHKNRQNSIEIDNPGLQDDWSSLQRLVKETADAAYDWAISNNIAKEQARVVMPEGLTMSRLYMSGTLRSWIHYVQLRADEGTQKEHREIAILCKDILEKEFPSLKELI